MCVWLCVWLCVCDLSDRRVPKEKVPLAGHVTMFTDNRWTCVQLSSGIQEAGNDNLEDLHDDGKMKLSSDSSQHGEEERVQERSGSAL